jgi:tetratricopeptide (TPR) repeat protein
LGVSHPDTAESLHGLAQLYQQQGKYGQAELLYQRALHIREQLLGLAHPETENTRQAYAALLRLLERDESATVLDTGDKPSAEEDEKCNNKRKTPY